MRIIQVIGIASLLLVPGAIAPAFAQGREQEKQPEKQQAKPAQQQAKPAAQPQHAQQQAKPAVQPQRAQQEAKPAVQPQRAQQPAKPAAQPQRAQQQTKPAVQPQRAQQQARPAQQPQRAQAAAGHGRIPDDRFRSSFGSGHTFHVSRANFSGGSGRFQYGGFWFAIVNPWPAAWLYTDSVYVDYMNGGYFLCDPIHPGVFLSITVG
jgi:hypothetical protein